MICLAYVAVHPTHSNHVPLSSKSQNQISLSNIESVDVAVPFEVAVHRRGLVDGKIFGKVMISSSK